MSVLLRQPHGFEGFGGVDVVPLLDDLAGLERVDGAELDLDGSTASLALPAWCTTVTTRSLPASMIVTGLIFQSRKSSVQMRSHSANPSRPT